MEDRVVIETQLEFYRNGRAGCLFAAHAAKSPEDYGWRFSVCDINAEYIEILIQSAITDASVSTQSIIFPRVISRDDLLELLSILATVPSVILEQQELFEDAICLGYRIKVDDLVSWATGFGGFGFLPKTRQAVFTEIVFRSKPRPQYEWVMKEASEGVIHLADMDMRGMSENQLKALWYGSFDNTERSIGHKPDMRSAAKTTFAVPVELWNKRVG